MKILLIHPPSPESYQAFLPLGLSYIAAALRDSGHAVTVWDMNMTHTAKDDARGHLQATVGQFDMVGITALTGDYPHLRWLTRTIRDLHSGVTIVAGGHLPSALPAWLMERLPIDYVVVGEGEQTIAELAKALSDNDPISGIAGLYYKTDTGKIAATPPRSRAKDLSDLPLPPWVLFPMTDYLAGRGTRNTWQFERIKAGEMPIMASRGCPYGCIYCDHTVKGVGIRYRPVERVIEEIRAALDTFGGRIKYFYFWDDILLYDRQWTLDFCQALARARLEINWTCNGHVRRVDPELMAAMKDAGCNNVRFGIESGSQRILDALNKGVRAPEALNALQVCLDAGLTLTLYIMVGMTGESRATIAETAAFFEQLVHPTTVYQIAKIHFFLIAPFPGTRLFEEVFAQGLVGDMETFLMRGFDVSYDIPLNISGRSDQDLLELKENLEQTVSGIMQAQTNRLHRLLLEMKQQHR